MLKLVSDTDTYELVYSLKDEPEEKFPVFVLKKLSGQEVNNIQDKLTITEPGSTKMAFLSGTSTRLKIDKALVDWKNVFDKDGQPVPCTKDSKEKLPSSVQSFLEENINKVNKLAGYREEERKNS